MLDLIKRIMHILFSKILVGLFFLTPNKIEQPDNKVKR